MDLNMKVVAVASLLGSSVGYRSDGRTFRISIPDPQEIAAAVRIADAIWKEVTRQHDGVGGLVNVEIQA